MTASTARYSSGAPASSANTPGRIKWIGRPVGKDNEDVYRGLAGLNRQELASLKKGGVI